MQADNNFNTLNDLYREQILSLISLMDPIPTKRLQEIAADYIEILDHYNIWIGTDNKGDSVCRFLQGKKYSYLYPVLGINREALRLLRKRNFTNLLVSDQRLKEAIAVMAARCVIRINHIPNRQTVLTPEFTKQEKRIFDRISYTLGEMFQDRIMFNYTHQHKRVHNYLKQNTLLQLPLQYKDNEFIVMFDNIVCRKRMPDPNSLRYSNVIENVLPEQLMEIFSDVLDSAMYYQPNIFDTLNLSFSKTELEDVLEGVFPYSIMSHKEIFKNFQKTFVWLIDYCKAYRKPLEIPRLSASDASIILL